MELNTADRGKFFSRPVVVFFAAILCTALWGSAFPCIKIGYRLFDIASGETATQILFAGCRFTLAGFLTVLLMSVVRRKALIPKKKSTVKHIFMLSLFQTMLQYSTFYIGLAHTTGVKSSVIKGMSVFMCLLVASLIFRQEKLTRRKILGCVLGFIGIVIVNLEGLDFQFSAAGEGLILASEIAYAFSAALTHRFSSEDDPALLSGWQFFIGGIVLIAVGYLFGGKLRLTSVSGAMMLLYLANLSAIAYTLWSILLKYNPVSKVTVYSFLNSTFGVLLSALLLKESLAGQELRILMALLFVVSGILIVNRAKSKESA